MKTTEFQSLLFQSAVYSIAVDGEIHNEEIEEVMLIAKNTAYFLDFQCEEELNTHIDSIRKNGREEINNFLLRLTKANLSLKQEAVLIEVLLRLMEADKKLHDSEMRFLKMIRSRLKMSDELLVAKFPKYINYLIDLKNFGSHETFNTEIRFE